MGNVHIYAYIYCFIRSSTLFCGFIVVYQLIRNYRIEGVDTLLYDYVFFFFEFFIIGRLKVGAIVRVEFLNYCKS